MHISFDTRYAIFCADATTLLHVLEELDEAGCIWNNGHKPLDFYMTTGLLCDFSELYLIISHGRITIGRNRDIIHQYYKGDIFFIDGTNLYIAEDNSDQFADFDSMIIGVSPSG